MIASNQNSDRPYTVAEAAEKAGINVKTAYAAVRLGQWPSIRIGRAIRIPRPAFNRLIETGKTA